MKLDLPSTGPEQPPAFTDATACRFWCAALPMGNPVQVQAQLLRQISLMNRYTLDVAIRLVLMEILREPVHFVQEAIGKKFSGRPLPLAPPEQAAFETTHGLWQALATAYLHCLAGTDTPAQGALVCGRVLGVLQGDYLDLMRAGMPPDGLLWRRAHGVYAWAEKRGASPIAVGDPFRDGPAATVVQAYVELLLIAAANLHELTPRQQAWVARWAGRWADKVDVLPAPPPESPALPLCVDLDSDTPARFRPYGGPNARWLDTTLLRKSLKKRLRLLAEGGGGNTPEKLGLGSDCPQPACGEALRRLYPRWVKGGVSRRHDRHPMHGPCRFVVGVDAIHYYLCGSQPFKSPVQADTDLLRRQREELATFGRVAERFEDEYSRNHGYRLENWDVVEDWGMIDQSSGGLRLERVLRQPGGRLAVGQLVAVQPVGASGLLLGAVRWAQITGERLTAGIQLFPGRPDPVAVRATGLQAEREPWRPGFLLPPVASLELSACAILPPGSFKPNRIIEAWSAAEGSRRIRLQEAFDRGADYERVMCSPAED